MRTHVYFQALASLGSGALCSDGSGNPQNLDTSLEQVVELARRAHDSGRKLMFIGNGGSAAIASHMANDYSKNGRLRSVCFNDGSALTCLGNDLGYENVFAYQIELHGQKGDLLLAISSSGRSPNILKAVEAARGCGANVVTFSGFGADNPLRRAGDLNFYVASRSYGFVEISHLALCHAVLDYSMGWSAVDGAVSSS